MGASGWIYFCDYQPDIGAVLAALRTVVFDKGAYYCPPHVDKATISSVHQLQDLCAEDGTHSILDIARVGDKPPAQSAWGPLGVDGFSTVFPLAAERYEALFGTVTPTRAQVVQRQSELTGEYGRWQGCYVVWEDETGKGVCFAGHSGD